MIDPVIRTGALAAAAWLAMVMPSTAATKVHFSFTADGTPVKGVMTLDCPPAGPCSILTLNGTFGSTPISRDPVPPPPKPPEPLPPVTPDNQVKRPGYGPTSQGWDFWGPVYHRFSEDPDEENEAWRLFEYVAHQNAYVREYLVTDYEAYVPEPATWAMLLTGFVGVGAAMRRSRRAVAGADGSFRG